MGRRKNRIIPDKVFYNLINHAMQNGDLADLSSYIYDKKWIQNELKKAGFVDAEIYILCQKIINITRIDLKELKRLTGFTDKELSYLTCTSIRNIDNWEKNGVPLSIQILILMYADKLDLGPYIERECGKKMKGKNKGVYNKKKTKPDFEW